MNSLDQNKTYEENKPCISIEIYPIEYDKNAPLSARYDPREVLRRFIKAYDPEDPKILCYIFDEDSKKTINPKDYGIVFIEANCSLIRTQD